ncbi:2-C-methyl-D-erythritol 4-phosphate cytidylyltransferase [Arcanobacterium pluranimalium]|uniref:2-C-methyl-D-erythritol 4-phosphate cytidylyltransferase n=1 Tax=Arcanobacterium pluranimalium TaxID=108028 RepID=UPI001959B5A2|nr:2-C-methyl-D-erythritol 4-phosphate cytidylyltransferase [Arcanobacterium pluranimalium]MBM7824590.1 2-C-methyl-D-erythritol 4-phosphate cytidylyltransferase [Arcanobacterium pluranimalium]
MKIAALIVAAGSGSRLGAPIPKALVELAGEALIVHALRGMNNADVTDVVVTIPTGCESEFAAVLEKAGLDARLVVGGATRQESVARGLAQVDADVVLVHDAARALTPSAVIRSVVAALENGHRAVIPVLAVTDTIKKTDANDVVTETLDRASLRAVQTPQGFDTALLRQAHEQGKRMSESEQSAAPDDAALVELLGEAVFCVRGDAQSLKVTTPFDLAVAELILDQREAYSCESGR